MEHRMNLGLWWKLEVIGHLSYAFSNLEGTKKSFGQFWVALPSDRRLTIWSQLYVHLLPYLKGDIIAFLVCVPLHHLLGLLQFLLELGV